MSPDELLTIIQFEVQHESVGDKSLYAKFKEGSPLILIEIYAQKCNLFTGVWFIDDDLSDGDAVTIKHFNTAYHYINYRHPHLDISWLRAKIDQNTPEIGF